VHIHGEYETTGTHIHDACDEAESRADYVLDTLRALLPPNKRTNPDRCIVKLRLRGRKMKNKRKKEIEGRKKKREIK
jgi:hypothetical protein